MVLNQESYQSDTSDVPLSCIYTGYTSQHGKPILYRDNICFVNEQHTQIFPVDQIWPAADPEYWTMVQTVRSAFQKAETEIRYGTKVQLYS